MGVSATGRWHTLLPCGEIIGRVNKLSEPFVLHKSERLTIVNDHVVQSFIILHLYFLVIKKYGIHSIIDYLSNTVFKV